MATSEQVQFAQQKTIPQAVRLLRAYYDARETVNEWFAQGIGSIIPNDSTVILTGDGGFDLTGAMITNFITRQMELCADMEANSNAKLNTLIQATSGRS